MGVPLPSACPTPASCPGTQGPPGALHPAPTRDTKVPKKGLGAGGGAWPRPGHWAEVSTDPAPRWGLGPWL